MDTSKSAVEKGIIEFFESNQWKKLIKVLERGEDVYHMHAFADTKIHPSTLSKLVEGYFKRLGWGLGRKIRLYPEPSPHTMANIYGVYPPGKAYFEIILKLTPDSILSPTTNKDIEFWDKQYMTGFYKRFALRSVDSSSEEKTVRDYFKSGWWTSVYDFVRNPKNLHCHISIRTCIHPLKLIPFAREAIESNKFTIQKVVSVVFGKEIPKIVFLVQPGDTFIELDWEFDPNVIICPAPNAFSLVLNQDMLNGDLAKCDFLIDLDEKEIENIISHMAV